MAIATYDALLNSWSAQVSSRAENFDGGCSEYSDAAHDYLTDESDAGLAWNITYTCDE